MMPAWNREGRMTPAATARAADLLCAARLERRRLDRLPEECRPADERAAYAVQDALHAALTAAGHGALAGHKIGCTTAVMQRFLGITNPCAGGVFAPTLRHGAGEFRHADFRHVGVECEIAVRLARDLPAAGAPYDRAAAGAAVGACMAAIEVVDDRYEDYRTLDTPTLIADDFFNAACVLGVPIAAWRTLDLAGLRGRMTINGAAVGTGRGGDILGHPLEALAWLANALAARDRGLEAGAFVLLGSVVETRWVARGDRVEVEIEGLGAARARFA
jgi:2-oxo-3-hexenedioate decarboxylase/2-keto-4-pentenoate hydratase